jgi:hypothetical protein
VTLVPSAGIVQHTSVKEVELSSNFSRIYLLARRRLQQTTAIMMHKMTTTAPLMLPAIIIIIGKSDVTAYKNKLYVKKSNKFVWDVASITTRRHKILFYPFC